MPLNNLNPEQKKAVTYRNGPLLIVAGAGTGKTTVVTERVAWLIEQKLARADEVLALTFTDKAAGEMEERIDKLLPYGYVDLWVMTFHSFCERILKNHALDIGLPTEFKLLNQTEQWILVRENLDKFNLDYYRPLGNPTKFIHALLKHFSRCKDEEVWPEDYLKYAENLKVNLDNMESTGGRGKTKARKSHINEGNDLYDTLEIKRLEEVANAYHTYQQLLLDNEALDFGDLINYTLKLFRQRPQILRFYQQKFKYILVDEFQDTNWAQYELIKLLAAKHQNLTVVGDDDQSIYKFRGASVSNIMQFKDDYPQSADIYLTKNYRSSQNILDMAYNFIQLNNPERLEVKLQSQQKKKQLSKRLQAQTQDEGSFEHLHLEDKQQEAAAVVEKIIELKNQDKSATWNDFAILMRANNQAEPFLNALIYAGIPFSLVASKGLYYKEAIRDILAYLKLLDNYHESTALWRILNLKPIKMPVADLMELTRYASRKTLSLFEAAEQVDKLVKISQAGRDKIKYITAKIRQHTSLAQNKTIREVILSFLKDFKYDQYLIAQNDNRSVIYINSFLKRIADYEEANDNPSLKGFIELVNLELESGEQGDLPKEAEEGPEAVKVMTVHAAKGLEFKYVFIINMVDKRFPSIERREPIELPDALVKEIIPAGDIHLQEERRLFYVAITRAKRGVWLTSADNYGGKTRKKLSRFLYELGIIKKEAPQKPLAVKLSWEKTAPEAELAEGDKQVYNLPNKFSYSQLKAFETCPYQYYLQFILKIPVRGKSVFSFGKTMHLTLQRFMSSLQQSAPLGQANLFARGQHKEQTKKHMEIMPWKQLLEIYQQAWIDDWYENKKEKEEYRQLGIKSLKEFYQRIKENPPQVLALEKGFNFKLDEYTIKGTIDRVDKLANGKVEIIDYKTGTPKTDKTLKDKDQLLIYQLAAQEVFGWEVEKLTYYYLNDNSRVSFLGSEKEMEKLKKKILDLIERIRRADWHALPSQHNCKYCDFKEICEYKF